MAHMKKMELAVMNIKIHPHSPEKYIDLFKKTFKIESLGKIRGSDWGTIGSLRETTLNNKKTLHGTIYRFLNIDPSAPWLDLNARKAIQPDEEGGKLPVAEHLKPNCKEILYIFYPDDHRLFFECRNISPGSMRKLLRKLFSERAIFHEFGEVDVDIESTKEAIKSILKIPRMTRLQIVFHRPNDDQLIGARKRVAKRLEDQGIKHLDQIATTTDKDGLSPDIDTKALMDLARSNGKVIGVGYDGEQKIILSTEEHPLKKAEKYYPDIENRLHVMARIATALIYRIKS